MIESGDGSEVQFKKPHPFFSGPNGFRKNGDMLNPPTPDPSCSPTSDNLNDPTEPCENLGEDLGDNLVSHSEPLEPKPKRRKTRASAGTSEIRSKPPRKKRQARHSGGPNIISHFRQKGAKDEQIEDNQVVVDELPLNLTDSNNQHPVVTATKPADVVDRKATQAEATPNTPPNFNLKPQKLLKFNPATGTIGSPPPAKPIAPSLAPGPRKRGRKRKTLVVTIPYGADSTSRQQVGQRVQEIINGNARFTRVEPATSGPDTPPSSQNSANGKKPAMITPKKRTPRKTVTPKKPSHPFFQAQAKPTSSATNDGQRDTKNPNTSPRRQVIFTSTPCSPRRPRAAPQNFSLPAIGSKYSGGMKIPGAQHPAWPWRDMVHIRDNSTENADSSIGSEPVLLASRRRKAKGQTVQLGYNESILCEAVSRLGIRGHASDIGPGDSEHLRPVPSTIRVPTKHFESGHKLQSRVFPELRTLKTAAASSKSHPAIEHLYNSVATTLSAFDRSTCESTAWTQKYAPTFANCVLQSGREAELLRDWLRTLKVQAVDTGSSDVSPKGKGGLAVKRRRRSKKLEGFVVSSDEEANEMDEISENESEWLAHGGASGLGKTVVRSGDAMGKSGGRLTNAVLLSGPHGCGKTATVYAIAKELGFEVFEINAGARRSGKDILERVGDMTRNHQVKHNPKGDSAADITADDGVTKDSKSGKQGMMTAFFQPKQAQPKKGAHKSPKEPEIEAPEAKAPLPVPQEKRANRDQKQSLILLEEVDILYEEDKQFWSTVITMIAQSKRPFVMTCNNESVIPLHSLRLHGIFRLSPPPSDLAVDLLLLIAANEGHALGRHAVEALYDSRGHDLRAAITELNYWCQIGVGDPRGGFDWFYPRWPKGSDVDAEGNTIRVISQDTYRAGMGWLNRDLAFAASSLPSVVPELHQQAWEHWGLDISDHHELGDPSDWAKKATEQASSRVARLELLRSIESFADRISESDICDPFLPSPSKHVPLDATIPGLHAKTLDDFTIGNKLLEVMPIHFYDSTSMQVAASLRMLAQSSLLAAQPLAGGEYHSKHFNEKCVTDDIERHIKTSSQSEGSVTRVDYSIAFDPIAASEKMLASGHLDPSVFDGTMVSICLDVAPFVRSIVAYDQRLQVERRMRSSLISEGGKPEKKRMRTTRAALSALEGGSRASTRREKYFAADINPYLVMRTGGKRWEEIALQQQQQQQLGEASKDRGAEAREDHVGTDADIASNQDP